jgi:hypothetical protein
MLATGCSVSVHVGSGPKALARAKVEKETSDELTKTVGERPKKITCPHDLPAVKGTKMRCQLEASDGSTIGLTLTVTSAQGSDVKFHIQVDKK